MISTLSEEAVELGKLIESRLTTVGGVDLLRKYAGSPSTRQRDLEQLLDPFGLWDLDPQSDALELEAACSAARASGRVGLPYPLVERLARPNGRDGLVLVHSEGRSIAHHGDLAAGWAAVDLAGNIYEVVGAAQPRGTRLGTFVAEVDVQATGRSQPSDAALILTLQSWWLLGLLEQANSDTCRYVGEREQFGRPLHEFQSVGFRLADMSVAIHKVEELAKYTAWSLHAEASDDRKLVDALGLRVASLETAETVLRGTHQLHGAMGFCDETDVTWLSLASQPVRRLPTGHSQTVASLTRLTLSVGMAGPYAELENGF